jgi:DNA-binding transcriptional LysR family regulator
MELRQLEYFVAVAEEANFTRAAERVHISQSGVSAQIRQLENELGATLIDRSGRNATVTPAGAAALEQAKAVLASVTAIRRSVDDVTGLIRGRITVGMVTACMITPLFDALAAFHGAHPGVEIALSEDNSDRLIEGVRSGAIDVALVGVAGTPPEGLSSLTIISERLVAVVPAGHPLDRAHHRPSLAEVCAHPIVCLPAGTGIRTVFDDACTTAGIRPNIALQAAAPGAVADLAARGLGIAILSQSTAPAGDDRLRTLVVDDVHTPSLLSLVWRTAENRAVQALLDRCRTSFGLGRSGGR